MPCPSGTTELFSTCLPCSAGSHQPLEGQTRPEDGSSDGCLACQPGTYAQPGAAECSLCPAGTYREEEGAVSDTQCISCPKGSWSSTVAANTSAVCQPCPAGTASPSVGANSSSACAECKPGTYGPEGSPQCEPCLSGTYSSQSGLTSPSQCDRCPRGKHGVGEGFADAAAACAPCPAGTAGRREGLRSVSECDACGAGLVAPRRGMPLCEPCGNNRFAANESFCARCEPEFVLTSVGDACDEVCEAGLVPSRDQRSCTPCAPGTVAPTGGLSSCSPCGPGTFAPTPALTACTLCPVGTYAEEAGTASCRRCVESRTTMTSGSSAKEACLCVEERWVAEGASPLDAFDTPCGLCPVGGVCEPTRHPYAQPGFWYDVWDRSVPSDVFVVCTPREACVGGDMVAPNVSAACVASLRDRPSEAVVHCPPPSRAGNMSLAARTLRAEELLCDGAYRGKRCSLCEEGHYRFDSRCLSCPDQSLLLVLTLLALLVVGIAVVRLMAALKLSLAPLTITVDFFQVLGRQTSIDAHWSSNSATVLNWASLFDFDLQLAAPECVVDVDYAQTWIATMAVPWGGLVALAIGHAIVHGMKEGQRLLANILLLCQLAYMALVLKTLQALDCVTLQTGEQVLEVSPDIVCWTSDRHRPLIILGGAAVVLYVVGIPAAFLAALESFRRARRRESLRHTRWWSRATAPLARRFRATHPRWILVIMARKALLATGVVLQTTRPGMQLTLTMSVLAASLFVQAKQRPYGPLLDFRRRGLGRVANANLMEEASLVASLVVVAGGLAFNAAHAAELQGVPLGPRWLVLLDVVVIGSIGACTAIVLSITVYASRQVGMSHHRRRIASKADVMSRGDVHLRSNPMFVKEYERGKTTMLHLESR